MSDQLDFGFNIPKIARRKKARAGASAGPKPATIDSVAVTVAPPILLFEDTINIDIHLHDDLRAMISIVRGDAEWTSSRLLKLAGGGERTASRKLLVAASTLDRFLSFAKPHQVTMDAASVTVARALWARSLGWKPLKVVKRGRRLLAYSWGWPKGWQIKDAPWTAIVTLVSLGMELDIDPDAHKLLLDKLAKSGHAIAKAGISGTSVILETNRGDLIEKLELPALAYAGPKGTGSYRVPLLVAESLLRTPLVTLRADVKKTIEGATKEVKTAVNPPGFPRQLYPFQLRDLAKGMHIIAYTGGVLLAGEMGSGKTTISLAMAQELDMWPLLVVAPLAAFSTWERQVAEMERSVLLSIGNVEDEKARLGDFDCVVISYDRLHRFVDACEQRGFAGIIADEIQRIRTPTSRRSRALRRLAGAVPLRIGLSGTPVTNRVEDILPLGAFLVPGEWQPRLTSGDLADVYAGVEPLESLAEHLGTMMVRRRMEDTGANLPGRHVKRVAVPLSADQRRALSDMEAQARADKDNGELSNRIHVFTLLQKMRQIVNAPSAAGIMGPNAKVEAAVDLAQEYSDKGRKSVIFVADRAAWREVGEMLERRGIQWTGIWGSTPIVERMGNEKLFHEDDKVRVFVGTLAACAESLTLSPTATVTIFASLSYSPSALAQAAARAYRMNQTNEVDEIYLHATAPGGTIDDRMYEILESKRHLIAQVVDRDEHQDPAERVNMSDLVYMLTGERGGLAEKHEQRAQVEKDADVVLAKQKAHAKATIYRRKTGDMLDDGAAAITREDYNALEEVFEEDRDDDQTHWEN